MPSAIADPCCRCARRGGRCPVWAHAVAVCACSSDSAAVLAPRGGAPKLATLAAFATLGQSAPRHGCRRSRACGAGRPPRALCSSPPQKSPTPGTAHRAASPRFASTHATMALAKLAGGCASAATLCGAEERRARGRARTARASSSDSPRLFERSERSERSEFPGGPRDRAPEGIRSEAEDAAHERRRTPARGFALSVVKQR